MAGPDTADRNNSLDLRHIFSAMGLVFAVLLCDARNLKVKEIGASTESV